MSEQRAKILESLKMLLAILVDRRIGDVPMVFRPMLAKLSPESLTAMIEGELSEEDWLQIEAIFSK